jgi:hypothetical protein
MEGERQSDGGARLLGITTEYLGAPAPDMQRQLRHPEASNAEMKVALVSPESASMVRKIRRLFSSAGDRQKLPFV